MNVTYKQLKIKQNNVINKTITKNKPTIKFYKPTIKFYTIIMYDPDALFIHWVVINNTNGQINGEPIMEYMGPSPPIIHHYQFLLYEQPNKINKIILLILITKR